MFKIEAGKKYVCRDGSIVTLQWSGDNLMGNDWLFSPKYPDKDDYRVFDYMEHPHDIVAPYVEKKTRKASSPYKKLLTAKQGDIFLLKGEKFIVEDHLKRRIFLTSLDRQNQDFYRPIHVRYSKSKRAVFHRQELINLLRRGKYSIS